MDFADNIRDVLRDLAEADASGVLEDARAAARGRVQALLEDELTDLLLHAVRSRAADGEPIQPGGTSALAQQDDPTEGTAWWAYCVLDAGKAMDLSAGLDGLEPGTAVETVTESSLAALVSPVPLPDYGDERLRAHLEDLDWLERTARGHETVLERALAKTSIVPLRLCTIYREREGVRRLLREQHAALARNLDLVDGCVEWGVKVFLDEAAATRAARMGAGKDADPDGVLSPGSRPDSGAAYLAERQRERQLAGQVDSMCSGCLEDVEETLRPLARASRGNPPQRPEAHGRDAEMILNAAYLVERGRQPELETAISELSAHWADVGLDIELTGPWPPYNFVSDSAGVLG